MKKLTFGYAITGSFCTFHKAVEQIEYLTSKGIDILPIMSENAYNTSTRFGTADSFIDKIETLTGRKILHTIVDTEPIGPKNLTDLMIVSPCTGNTAAKLAYSIYDSPVTLAVKSHLRGQKPVLIGVSTNDALSSSAKNIGELMNRKHYYFIPMEQDAPDSKPFSLVCDFSKTYDAAVAALEGRQLQPIIS